MIITGWNGQWNSLEFLVFPDFAELLGQALNNGEYIVGISSGVDAALVEADKLKIPSKPTENTTNEQVLANIKFSMSHITPTGDANIDRWTVHAVAAVYMYGVVNPKSNDVAVTALKDNSRVVKDVVTTTTDIRNMMALICATKLNFFQTNHHTGQGSLSGLPLKIFSTLFNSSEEITITPEITSAIHKFGHWACTKKILSTLGITGIQKTQTLRGVVQLNFANDFRIRQSVMPAGTAGLALSYAIIRKMKTSKIIYALENPHIITTIAHKYREVQSNQAKYHMSAVFLTGEERAAYNDHEFLSMLGLLGSYITIFYPGSTLCRSPRIKKGERLVYRDYEMYDEAFEALCMSVKKAQAKGAIGDVANYMPTVNTSIEERKAMIDKIITDSF